MQSPFNFPMALPTLPATQSTPEQPALLVAKTRDSQSRRGGVVVNIVLPHPKPGKRGAAVLPELRLGMN